MSKSLVLQTNLFISQQQVVAVSPRASESRPPCVTAEGVVRVLSPTRSPTHQSNAARGERSWREGKLSPGRLLPRRATRHAAPASSHQTFKLLSSAALTLWVNKGNPGHFQPLWPLMFIYNWYFSAPQHQLARGGVLHSNPYVRVWIAKIAQTFRMETVVIIIICFSMFAELYLTDNC